MAICLQDSECFAHTIGASIASSPIFNWYERGVSKWTVDLKLVHLATDDILCQQKIVKVEWDTCKNLKGYDMGTANNQKLSKPVFSRADCSKSWLPDQSLPASQAFPFQPNEISCREKEFSHSWRPFCCRPLLLAVLSFVRHARDRERLLRRQDQSIHAERDHNNTTCNAIHANWERLDKTVVTSSLNESRKNCW